MSWKDVSISELVEKKVPQGPPKGKGDFYYIDISSIDNDKKIIIEPKKIPVTKAPSRAKQHVKAGDILVSMTRPNLNAVAVVPKELDGAIASTGFDVLRPVNVDGELLFRRLTSSEFVNEVTAKVQGALYPAIRSSDVREHRLKIPDSNEQKALKEKINGFFSEIDTGITELDSLVRNLTVFKHSILNSAIRGKLVPQDPMDEPASALIERIQKEKEKLIADKKIKKEKPLAPFGEDPFELPEGWTWTRLGNLFYSCMYGTSQKCTEEKKGTPVLRIPNVVSGELDFSDLKYAKFPKSELEKLSLQEGDLLVIRSNGSLNLVGTSCVYKKQEEDYLFAGYLIRLQFFVSLVEPEYIDLVLKSPFGRQQIESYAKSTSGVNNVNAQQLANLAIPLPPFKEQGKILEKVRLTYTAIKDMGSTVENDLKKAQQLKQSILKKAFEGEL